MEPDFVQPDAVVLQDLAAGDVQRRAQAGAPAGGVAVELQPDLARRPSRVAGDAARGRGAESWHPGPLGGVAEVDDAPLDACPLVGRGRAADEGNARQQRERRHPASIAACRLGVQRGVVPVQEVRVLELRPDRARRGAAERADAVERQPHEHPAAVVEGARGWSEAAHQAGGGAQVVSGVDVVVPSRRIRGRDRRAGEHVAAVLARVLDRPMRRRHLRPGRAGDDGLPGVDVGQARDLDVVALHVRAVDAGDLHMRPGRRAGHGDRPVAGARLGRGRDDQAGRDRRYLVAGADGEAGADDGRVRAWNLRHVVRAGGGERCGGHHDGRGRGEAGDRRGRVDGDHAQARRPDVGAEEHQDPRRQRDHLGKAGGAGAELRRASDDLAGGGVDGAEPDAVTVLPGVHGQAAQLGAVGQDLVPGRDEHRLLVDLHGQVGGLEHPLGHADVPRVERVLGEAQQLVAVRHQAPEVGQRAGRVDARAQGRVRPAGLDAARLVEAHVLGERQARRLHGERVVTGRKTDAERHLERLPVKPAHQRTATWAVPVIVVAVVADIRPMSKAQVPV